MAPIALEIPAASLDRRPAAYSPDILPFLQSFLGTLADIDLEFGKDLGTVTNSALDEGLKQKATTTLKQRHQERRAPYLRGISARSAPD